MHTDNDRDYVYLRAWNRLTDGPQMRNLDLARLEKAPRTAIYPRKEGGWATYEEISRPDTKLLLDSIIDEWRYFRSA